MENSTIAAIATPIASGGIGIVKISGKDAMSIVSSVFISGRSGRASVQGMTDITNRDNRVDFKSHHVYYGHIIDPENGKTIDEVLLVVMLAPKSYTREDVVEIHAHSGYVVLKTVLDIVIKCGARLAEPGEFTKRAFLNGRIDLSQAEAVIDIINAKTKKALEIAADQINGNIRSAIELIRNYLINILTEIEAVIDFPNNVEESYDDFLMFDEFNNNVTDRICFLINQYKNAHIIRDGIRVMIAGRPNVGKSSLMNCLAQRDRAIVTSIPGTTRDLIQESINIAGIPVILTDTAGLQETEDPVEIIGIKKAYECLDASDLVLFVVDAIKPFTQEDKSIYEKVKHKPNILVVNKIDLVGDDFIFSPPGAWSVSELIFISALYNKGINKLCDAIETACFSESGVDTSVTILPNLRHKLILDRCLTLASSIEQGVKTGLSAELIAIDIQETIDLLGEIIGVTVKEDVLDQIFSRFCIGK